MTNAKQLKKKPYTLNIGCNIGILFFEPAVFTEQVSQKSKFAAMEMRI